MHRTVLPNGMNQHGHLKDMEVNLSDFALMPLTDEHTTIGDMVDKDKLNKLKFYLKTRLRSPSSTRERNTNDTESIDGDISPMLRLRVHSTLGGFITISSTCQLNSELTTISSTCQLNSEFTTISSTCSLHSEYTAISSMCQQQRTSQ